MPPEWLQYGSFGLLCCILFFIGKYLRNRDEKSQEFLRDLIERAEEQQANHAEAWKELTRTGIETQQQMKAQWDIFCTDLALHEEHNAEDHRKILECVKIKNGRNLRSEGG